MAKKKIATEKAETALYSKSQILASKKYRHNKDIINALLDDGKMYLIEDVDKIINDFYKKKIV